MTTLGHEWQINEKSEVALSSGEVAWLLNGVDRWQRGYAPFSYSYVRHVGLLLSVGAKPTPEVVVHREAV